MKLFRVVLTGGPCGGKSSSLKSLKDTLRGKGYRVMTMPEVPTILMSNGAQFPGINGPREKLLLYETHLINLQIAMEDSFIDFLTLDGTGTNTPGVLICDRGTNPARGAQLPNLTVNLELLKSSAAPDTAAYLPDEIWEPLLTSMDQTHTKLLKRYDIVCHLVTTANGASAFYTADNNSVRTETPAEARALDIRTQACWTDHPCHRVFHNLPGQNFEGKLNSVTSHILEQLELKR